MLSYHAESHDRNSFPGPDLHEHCRAISTSLRVLCCRGIIYFIINFQAIQIVKKRRKVINLWRFSLPIASINRAYKDVADNHRVSEYIQIILKLHFNAANETKTFCLSNVLYIFNFLYTCIHISIYTNLYHKFTLAMCLHYLHVFTIDNTWVSKSSSVMQPSIRESYIMANNTAESVHTR